MKQLLAIVLLGTLLFLMAAIVQEWDYFSSRWFGADETAASDNRESDEVEALATVRTALAMMAHYYSSGGDPRFAERMPVGPELLDELRVDAEYLARNRRFQESRLQKLELLSVVSAGEGRLELNTREYWVHRTFWSDSREESDPPRSGILHARYDLLLENSGWRIFGWDFDRPPVE